MVLIQLHVLNVKNKLRKLLNITKFKDIIRKVYSRYNTLKRVHMRAMDLKAMLPPHPTKKKKKKKKIA